MKKNLLLPLLSLILSGCGPVASHYNQKGAEAFAVKDLVEARRCFERAAFFDSDDPAILNNLGYVLYLQKDYEGADARYRKALQGRPGPALEKQVLMDQGELYCDPAVRGTHGGWVTLGIQAYQKLILDDPQNAEFHLKLGLAYFHVSNPGGGFEELGKAVQWADPVVVARYTPDGKAGALDILHRVQGFYLGIKYAQGVAKVGRRIAVLEKDK